MTNKPEKSGGKAQDNLKIDRDDLDEVVAIAAKKQAEQRGLHDDKVQGEELAIIAETIGLDHQELAQAKRTLEAQRREQARKKKQLLVGALGVVVVAALAATPVWWPKVFPPNYEALALESAQLTEEATKWRNMKVHGLAADAAFKAVKKDPKNFEAWNIAGLIYEDQRNVAKAREAYLKGIAVTQMQPEAAKLYSNYGLLLSKSPASRDEALKNYRLALQCDPRHATALNNLGFLYEQMGNLPEAKKHYEEALKSRRDHPEATSNLARVNKQLGLAHKPAPTEADAIEAGALRTHMWELYVKQNRTKQAIYLGLKGVSKFPDEFMLWNELGAAYEKDGQAVEAAKAYTTAVQLGGSQRDAAYPNYNMGRLMAAAGKHQQAADYYKKAVALSSGNKDYRLLLAREYESLDRTKEARAEFQAVLKLDPEHAGAREGLARLKGR